MDNGHREGAKAADWSEENHLQVTTALAAQQWHRPMQSHAWEQLKLTARVPVGGVQRCLLQTEAHMDAVSNKPNQQYSSGDLKLAMKYRGSCAAILHVAELDCMHAM